VVHQLIVVTPCAGPPPREEARFQQELSPITQARRRRAEESSATHLHEMFFSFPGNGFIMQFRMGPPLIVIAAISIGRAARRVATSAVSPVNQLAERAVDLRKFRQALRFEVGRIAAPRRWAHAPHRALRRPSIDALVMG